MRKTEGNLWQPCGSLRRFRLVGWPYYVEYSPRAGGWHYFWEGEDDKTQVFYRTRATAMRLAVECLREALEAIAK
jgi:hypothetical protein